MAIIESIKIYEERVISCFKLKYEGLNWGELGNQSYNGKPAKKMYEDKGVIHTSIDINGKDGALPLDLSKPITQKFEFDVLTNYGTAEHVENQYECFRNIHNMVKVGGKIIHGAPMPGNWKNHCHYYYQESFFTALFRACSYPIFDIVIWDKDFYAFPKNLITVVFWKWYDNEFISEDKFYSLPGLIDTRNI